MCSVRKTAAELLAPLFCCCCCCSLYIPPKDTFPVQKKTKTDDNVQRSGDHHHSFLAAFHRLFSSKLATLIIFSNVLIIVTTFKFHQKLVCNVLCYFYQIHCSFTDETFSFRPLSTMPPNLGESKWNELKCKSLNAINCMAK